MPTWDNSGHCWHGKLLALTSGTHTGRQHQGPDFFSGALLGLVINNIIIIFLQAECFSIPGIQKHHLSSLEDLIKKFPTEDHAPTEPNEVSHHLINCVTASEKNPKVSIFALLFNQGMIKHRFLSTASASERKALQEKHGMGSKWCSAICSSAL